MDIKHLTGENLKRLRHQHDMTQQQLADRLGVQKQNVSAMESGAVGIWGKRLQELCDIFALPPEEFYKIVHHQDELTMLDKLIAEEVQKMTKEGKAALFSHAVAINSGR